MQAVRFELSDAGSRREAYRRLWGLVVSDLLRGRVPTYHVLHLRRDGTAENHYITPISLEPVEGNAIAVWVGDFEFLLKLLLRLRSVVEVSYDPRRPAVVFTYMEPPTWNHSTAVG